MIAEAFVQRRTIWVLRLNEGESPVAVRRFVVETLAPRQVVLRVDSMPLLLTETELHTVVGGLGIVRDLQDVIDVGELRRERLNATFHAHVATDRRRVQIAVKQQIAAALSDVSERYGVLRKQLARQAEIEQVIRRCLQRRHNRNNIERRRARWIRPVNRYTRRDADERPTHVRIVRVETAVRNRVASVTRQRERENPLVRLCISARRHVEWTEISLRRADRRKVREIISERVTAAQRRLAVTKNVPGKTDTRSEVVAWGRIQPVQAFPEIDHSAIGEEI